MTVTVTVMREKYTRPERVLVRPEHCPDVRRRPDRLRALHRTDCAWAAGGNIGE